MFGCSSRDDNVTDRNSFLEEGATSSPSTAFNVSGGATRARPASHVFYFGCKSDVCSEADGLVAWLTRSVPRWQG